MLSPLQKANYTIDGEKAEMFSKVDIIPDSDVVAEAQEIIVLRNGTFYVFEFGSHFNTFNKSGEKEIGQHIIESINWRDDVYHGDFIPSCSGDYYHPCR